MLRQSLFLGLAATLVALLSTSQVQAWGALHVGYTHFGNHGIHHYGRTAAIGPYGVYRGRRYGIYNPALSLYRTPYLNPGYNIYTPGIYPYYGNSLYGGYYGGGLRIGGLYGTGVLPFAGVRFR